MNETILAEVTGTHREAPTGPLALAFAKIQPTRFGWLISSSEWEILSIDDRLELVHKILGEIAMIDEATALRWRFSGVLLDHSEMAFALSLWDRIGVPLLSLIDLRQGEDGLDTIGLNIFAGRELHIRCAAEYIEAAMLLSLHAAHYLLAGGTFKTGQMLLSGDLRGVVLATDADTAIYQIALVNAPNMDRDAVVN